MKKIMIPLGILLLLGAGDPWTDASSQDLQGYARALSLDIRGYVPTPEELTAIEVAGEVSEELLDSWLASEDFEEQVIEQHREFFWNELAINLLNLRKVNRKNGIYYNFNRSRHTRGIRLTHCGDFPAEVDSLNRPITWQENEDGSISEGYVEVSPYWAPDTTIQVCAFDAQLTEVSANGIDCSTEDAHQEADCGCGPNLQWCIDGSTENLIEDGLARDLSERVRHMLQNDLSYSEMLTGNTMFVNGPTAHFFQHIAPFNEDNYEIPVAVEELADIEFTDYEFTAVELPEHHDGILTSPGWLLRHQTNRGRANRFYGAFLCKEFIPPESGVVAASTQETPSPNLILREGCLDCHARLEPWAAYWGRWSEASMVYMSAEEYPAYSSECAECVLLNSSCSDVCDDFYLVEESHVDESPYLGWLSTYAFLTDDKREHPDLGPLGWVMDSVEDQSLATCSASNAADWLLNWDESDPEVLAAWSNDFNGTESYRSLIKSIVTSPQYWRASQ